MDVSRWTFASITRSNWLRRACLRRFLVWSPPPRRSAAGATEAPSPAARSAEANWQQAMREQLDAPLLFTKRHSYSGIHIYDTYYKWPPGGGGIYVIENPSAPREEWVIRAVIDPSTPETLGEGVYTDPELSWDATRLLFCFKGEPDGSTSIYEIGVDGRGLRRLTDPSSTLTDYHGSLHGQHDVCPAYLPDGRIVFLSTRPSGLVPCNNTGVAILHLMNADGSDIHPISVNNVNEFDPCPLPDGRILFGRWEYIDKNALTIQSLWTVNPDGTQETALYANNMVFPEAILDARPVPRSPLIVGTFAKHNSTPRGSIAMIDPRVGKNDVAAIFNFEHPDDPVHDLGNSCEPWPLSEDLVLFSGRPANSQRNVLEMIDRAGRRLVLHSDPDICLHAPMLVKPRPVPPVIPPSTDRRARSGEFFVQNIYEGLTGVRPGEIKWLRVIEETSRTSKRTDGPNPYNQVFLVSSALAFSAKSFLGIVPVEPDGSAYFEVPSGRAVYLQALDGEGRLVQSMRTFVQAAPGTTRSCIGCHEHKSTTPQNHTEHPLAMRGPPRQLQAESWGTGYVDYASMVQPVLNRHCVRCHGGTEDIAGGLDLSGGWTEHFNISYENLTNRVETQLMAYWIAGIDCMNGTALWSSQIFPPRFHGSGAAPLADVICSGHDGQIPDMTRAERDLMMAWIDTNGLYYGTWNRTASGCAIADWPAMKSALAAEMDKAGCLDCHGQAGQPLYFENDWVNLEQPEYSRLLRAPLAPGDAGYGLGWCRARQVTPDRQRLHLLRGGYAHAVQPPEVFPRFEAWRPDRSGDPVISFASPDHPSYRAMLNIIRDARDAALAEPRVDMPGARVEPGECRLFVPPHAADVQLTLTAEADAQGAVQLAWPQSAQTIGLHFELHRSSEPLFTPHDDSLIVKTPLFQFRDWHAEPGRQHYALVLVADSHRGEPVYASVDVPLPVPPAPPERVEIDSASGVMHVQWQSPPARPHGYHVERARAGDEAFERLTGEPVRRSSFADLTVQTDQSYQYRVRSVSHRGLESEPSQTVEATAQMIMEPVFAAAFAQQVAGAVYPDRRLEGQLHGSSRIHDGALDLRQGGHVTFRHDASFDLSQPLSVSCWVRLEQLGDMPIVVSCGAWNQAGWFLQRLGGQWRWHVGGVDCDGGQPTVGKWTHLAGIFDGRETRLYENGKLVARRGGSFQTIRWPGDLHVGQYSAGPGPQYQVIGQIQQLEIHHRPLVDVEVSAAVEQGPPHRDN